MTEIMNPEGRAERLEPLPLIADLLGELHRRGVRYCHWKSTAGLDRALTGQTDLDLLVDRAHAFEFDLAIRSLGFKPFVSHVSRRFPGVEDHIGHDATSGRLVHLHVYYQLILGEQYVKNHRLPLEKAFLDGARDFNGIPVPPPELELLVLGLRTLLKYRTVDAAKDMVRLGRRGGIPPDARAELEALGEQVSDDELRRASERHLPNVPPALVGDLLRTMRRDRRDAFALLRLRRQAVRGLAAYERYGRLDAARRFLGARLANLGPIRALRRGFTRSELRRKVPQGGGLTIALIGPDGAGKSTVVEALSEWLAWRLNLRVVYMGSAQPSPRTRVVKLAARIHRAAARPLRRLPGGGTIGRLVDVSMALRYLADARDRVDRARHGHLLASQGAVVLFDRFPLPGISVDRRVMDGPRIRTLHSAESSRMLRQLARREEAMYDRVVPPDHIIQLVVTPDVAVNRKQHRSAESVAEKGRVLMDADLNHIAPVTRIDADAALDDVLRQVRSAIWGLL